MKTKDTILNDLISDTISLTNKLTYFGKNSVLRGIYSALSFVFGEVWYDAYQLNRGAHIQTAQGTDLDTEAGREGIIRRGATKSSVVLLFNGPAGTVIPAGTLVKSEKSAVQYQTKSDITLGKNLAIPRPLFSNILGDAVIAESIEAGTSTRVGAKELTSLVNPITGVTVTNLVPSVGGYDAETDEELRQRIIDTYKQLNQGTRAFYEGLARSVDTTVLKVLPQYNYNNGGVDIYLLKNSLGVYSEVELQTIADAIYPLQRAMQPVKCLNANIKSIEIEVYLDLKTGYVLDDIFKDIAVKLSNKLDNSKLDFGATVFYYDLYTEVTKVEGIKKIYTFTVNNDTKDITCGGTEVPRFTTLLVTNEVATKVVNIEQSYLILE